MLTLFRRSQCLTSIGRVSKSQHPYPYALHVRCFASSTTALPTHWHVDNPYSGEPYAQVPILDHHQLQKKVSNAHATWKSWKSSSLSTRIECVEGFIKEFQSKKEQIAQDITGQMGKPIAQALGEVDTCIARARALIEMVPSVLAPEILTNALTLQTRITKEAIGPVLVLSPWNYPLLCAVNSVVSAVLSGDSVLLKHSERSPLCADHFADAFAAAGAPKGLVSAIHIAHDQVSQLISHPYISYVSFTGSVKGGRAVYSQVGARRFIDVGLELGGKDAAYLTDEVDLAHAIPNIIEGTLYNAGQSCCAVERVFVHESIAKEFLQRAEEEVKRYRMGNPLHKDTMIGPLAQPQHPKALEARVNDAVSQGAKLIVGGTATTDSSGKGRFFSPTLISDCTPDMAIMAEESFGPIIPICIVENDDMAIQHINNSAYGLTASIWTKNQKRAENFGHQVDVGTVYMNRCDYLDPYLPWSGRKDSGKGIGLSHYGFLPFVRTKAWNYRVATS